MTAKSSLQGRKQRETLFAQGGQIAANATKCLSASKTAEAARDLLLHLDHAQIAFSEVVVKIHAQIFQKAEGNNSLIQKETVPMARLANVHALFV